MSKNQENTRVIPGEPIAWVVRLPDGEEMLCREKVSAYSHGANAEVMPLGEMVPMHRCAWHAAENGTWETGCGNLFEVINGSPTENDMKFCPFCGGVLLEDPGMVLMESNEPYTHSMALSTLLSHVRRVNPLNDELVTYIAWLEHLLENSTVTIDRIEDLEPVHDLRQYSWVGPAGEMFFYPADALEELLQQARSTDMPIVTIHWVAQFIDNFGYKLGTIL